MNLNHGYVEKKVRIEEYKNFVDCFSGKWVRNYKEHKNFLPLDEESKLDLYSKAKLINIIDCGYKI